MNNQQIALQAIREGDFQRAAVLIEAGMKNAPGFARGHNVMFAHVLVITGKWELVEKLIPPGANFLTESGWVLSLMRGKPVNRHGEPVPWITYPAIEFLEPRIDPAWKVFEYGGGQSTLWWASRVAHVHTIEHDPQWVEILRKDLPENTTLEARTGQEEYVGALADSQHGPFDVVVIDAEYRNECALFVSSYVKDDGIIVFDNSDRLLYRQGMQHLMDSGWKRLDFFGLIPSYLYKNCTSIFYRDDAWLMRAPLPSDQQLSTGPTCSQAIQQ